MAVQDYYENWIVTVQGSKIFHSHESISMKVDNLFWIYDTFSWNKPKSRQHTVDWIQIFRSFKMWYKPQSKFTENNKLARLNVRKIMILFKKLLKLNFFSAAAYFKHDQWGKIISSRQLSLLFPIQSKRFFGQIWINLCWLS